MFRYLPDGLNAGFYTRGGHISNWERYSWRCPKVRLSGVTVLARSFAWGEGPRQMGGGSPPNGKGHPIRSPRVRLSGVTAIARSFICGGGARTEPAGAFKLRYSDSAKGPPRTESGSAFKRRYSDNAKFHLRPPHTHPSGSRNCV